MFCVTVGLYKVNRICLELSRGASKCTRVCVCARAFWVVDYTFTQKSVLSTM